MKHVFAVQSAEELAEFQQFVFGIQDRVDAYIDFLKREYRVKELPRCIVWTDKETATNLISDIPVPAYTNDFRIIFCPKLQTWKDIYLRQLDGLDGADEICDYYRNELSENHVMQILGHELAHHSDYFPDSDYEEGIWFEEGMVEYISRKFFLTEKEFQREAEINRQLVSLLANCCVKYSIGEFGRETYQLDYAEIFFEYWRSFLTVSRIIEKNNGDVHAVFQEYQEWLRSKCSQTLESWFEVEAYA